MAKGQGNPKLIVTIIVLAVTILSVIGILIWQNNQTDTPEATSTDTTTTPRDDTPADTDSPTDDEPDTPVSNTPDEESTESVDPATVSTIDIEPLGISVSYVKGIPGFEYLVMRTADSTEYVDFSAPELVGTKCTDDKGVFVSIIQNPSTDEGSATISKTVTVGEDSYGLSLASETCTSDVELLKQYQTSFSDAFTLLKSL